MSEYLLEIGSGELPYSEVKSIPILLSNLLENFFEKEVYLDQKPLIESYSTPRRVFITVKNLPVKTKTVEVEIIGPPLNISYKGNKPAVPLVQFMKKNGITGVRKVYTVKQERGVYTAFKKVIKGVLLKNILKENVPGLIKAVSFKKSMFWVDRDIRYPRPVLWIMSVFDGQVLPFNFGDVKASSRTCVPVSGKNTFVRVNSLEDYLDTISSSGIILKNSERRAIIESELKRISGELGVEYPEYEEDFMDEIIGITESPHPVACGFDEKFLSIPHELLSMVMRKHQRFFPLSDANGMTASFIGVANSNISGMESEDKIALDNNIKYGYSRVLRARLSDADFFFKEDLKKPVLHFVERTKGILFYKGLGSYYDKTERIKKIGDFIADGFDFKGKIVGEDFHLAADLLKFDLATQVVYEFPEMQGIAGRIYAGHSGENELVCRAVEEHYFPVSKGNKKLYPTIDLSALCALSDKLDTVLSFVMLKKLPSGESDPFYLRRAMIGIVEILIKKKYTIKLLPVFDFYFENFFKDRKLDLFLLRSLFINFANTRFKNFLLTEGFKADEVASAIESDPDMDFYSSYLKTEFVAKYRLHEEFFELHQVYKRIKNITVNFKHQERYEIKNLSSDYELNLISKLSEIKGPVENLLIQNKYFEALNKLYELKDPVNAFFDNILVMAEDADIKNSRLGLLNDIMMLFKNLCDFSMLSY